MAIIIHSYKCMYLVFTTYNFKKSFLRIIIAPPPQPNLWSRLRLRNVFPENNNLYIIA